MLPQRTTVTDPLVPDHGNQILILPTSAVIHRPALIGVTTWAGGSSVLDIHVEGFGGPNLLLAGSAVGVSRDWTKQFHLTLLAIVDGGTIDIPRISQVSSRQQIPRPQPFLNSSQGLAVVSGGGSDLHIGNEQRCVFGCGFG